MPVRPELLEIILAKIGANSCLFYGLQRLYAYGYGFTTLLIWGFVPRRGFMSIRAYNDCRENRCSHSQSFDDEKPRHMHITRFISLQKVYRQGKNKSTHFP
ncbi:hypothetical protein L1987_15932 [Smallanthus sonchifolius]|uniref:Uncharacterized protein n=1 Tax=Smallanthus sonchifolius TaxID=185202 RepID=A0ACB9J7F9_9ASTR|nr:hypothetical protein L1987_15932 [Smallanthus sonchifolius]